MTFDPWVLRIVIAVVAFNLIGFLSMGNIHAVVYYGLFAALTYFFSKDMVIVLGAPLLAVNLLAIRGVEGMEPNMYEEKDEGQDKEDKEDNKENKEDKEDYHPNQLERTTDAPMSSETKNVVSDAPPKEGFHLLSAASLEDAYSGRL